jgi:AraC family mar-sox-rob regulon transcriptional activator
MGSYLHKEVTMTLQLSSPHHSFGENVSGVSNTTQPLARGRDCDIFALRLRERPPEPPERLLEFFEPRPQRPLSHTTLKVIDALLTGDLSRIRSETVADSLRISPTTLRRRLSRDSMSYQTILDAVRRHRCEESLADDWVPGKCLAWDLGYAEVNSFYRAFRRWTGRNYSDVKLLLI